MKTKEDVDVVRLGLFLEERGEPSTAEYVDLWREDCHGHMFRQHSVCWLKFAKRLTSNVNLTMLCIPVMGYQDVVCDEIEFSDRCQTTQQFLANSIPNANND